MRYLGLANAQRMTEAPPWQRYPLALVFFMPGINSLGFGTVVLQNLQEVF